MRAFAAGRLDGCTRTNSRGSCGDFGAASAYFLNEMISMDAIPRFDRIAMFDHSCHDIKRRMDQAIFPRRNQSRSRICRAQIQLEVVG